MCAFVCWRGEVAVRSRRPCDSRRVIYMVHGAWYMHTTPRNILYRPTRAENDDINNVYRIFDPLTDRPDRPQHQNKYILKPKRDLDAPRKTGLVCL